jgi:hypothetical protein
MRGRPFKPVAWILGFTQDRKFLHNNAGGSCPVDSTGRFIPDSPLEEGGFEPSVPRWVSTTSNLFAARATVPVSQEKRFFDQDQQFESISLQRRVSNGRSNSSRCRCSHSVVQKINVRWFTLLRR